MEDVSRYAASKLKKKKKKKKKKKYDWEWDERRVCGEYRARGKNRIKAEKNGLPVVYDRLAVMAVSVFHLSHWRCDVTVDNYLLADGSADCSAPRP